MLIKIGGILSKMVTMADRTLRISLDLNEVSPELGAQILGQLQNFVNVVIVPEGREVKESELQFPKTETKPPEKTWSQRLRNVFYRLWEVDNQGFGTFDDYYESKMKQLVEHYKGKLDELK